VVVEGKVAIVTGGARGQGAAEARLLAQHGARVVVADVEDGEEVAAGLPNGIFERLDVSREEDWAAVVGRTVETFGRIDVLVNNAGILTPGGLLDTPLAAYERTVAVNQTGPLLGMRAVVPHMKKQGGGSIVNIASSGSLAGSVGALAYATSKWALRGMTKCIALELAPFSIRVNAVHPGRTETPMLSRTRSEVLKGGPAGADDPAARGVPLGRVGRPEEIAQLVLYLASNLSAFCTGADFVADGGQSAQLVTG
jgi:3alpha(or 20beta)-hydroxysteroid dehydrogenase